MFRFVVSLVFIYFSCPSVLFSPFPLFLTWWDLLLLDEFRSRWCSNVSRFRQALSDLFLSGCELPHVLQRISGPVVHVCLCIAQVAFGNKASNSATKRTSCPTSNAHWSRAWTESKMISMFCLISRQQPGSFTCWACQQVEICSKYK